MQKWEYKQEQYVNIHDDGLVSFLAVMGKEGWELVSMIPYSQIGFDDYFDVAMPVMLFFKRPLVG